MLSDVALFPQPSHDDAEEEGGLLKPVPSTSFGVTLSQLCSRPPLGRVCSFMYVPLDIAPYQCPLVMDHIHPCTSSMILPLAASGRRNAGHSCLF